MSVTAWQVLSSKSLLYYKDILMRGVKGSVDLSPGSKVLWGDHLSPPLESSPTPYVFQGILSPTLLLYLLSRFPLPINHPLYLLSPLSPLPSLTFSPSVCTPERNFHFCASSALDLHAWIDACHTAAGMYIYDIYI